MSFSADVKEELERVIPGARHCQLAELAALIHFGCKLIDIENNKQSIKIHSENDCVSRKCFTLSRKTVIINNCDAQKTLQAVKLLDEEGNYGQTSQEVSPLLLKNSCCRRAFLRGAFLCLGSMSNPRKGYHLEFVCEHEIHALQIGQVISSFDLEPKMVRRKKYYVVYLKEGAGIVDLLNIMGAHVSLMHLESLRVEKEVRNSINRRVNCEVANSNKTVQASSKQIEDIELLEKYYGLSNLPENLRQMAEVRLEYPDCSLQELGGYLNPPVGKSGVNHRLRKLSELADKIRV